VSESFESQLMRWKFNFFPAYRACGARLTYVAADFLEMRVRLDLKRKTRNYVGTLFGGSMYAAVDPIYMMMLIKILGPDYIVWDKAATIQFKKPGRSTLYADFILESSEIDAIKSELQTKHSIDRVYPVNLVDDQGVVHASVEKTVYVRKK
jgi:acyl-coenzyme A thioesterase PaaI-like protein